VIDPQAGACQPRSNSKSWPPPLRSAETGLGRPRSARATIFPMNTGKLSWMTLLPTRDRAAPSAWLGKTAKMQLSDIETTLETAPDIGPNNARALRRIREFRKLRNLLAHFAVKRFPTEDALVFVTKSAADYKRVLGAEPDPGVVMTAVADLGQIRDICRTIEEIQQWLSAATNDLENAFLKSKTSPT
jgi:hypothetical protein